MPAKDSVHGQRVGIPWTSWPPWRRRVWGRVVVSWVIFALLALAYYGSAPQPAVERTERPREFAPCMPRKDHLSRLTVRGREGVTTIERRGSHWYRGEQKVPQDLLEALFTAIGACASWPVVAGSKEEWPRFGLDVPVASLELETRSSQAPVRFFFGDANPVGTGRYVHMEDSARVYLAGVQAWYYAELLAGRTLDKRR